MPKLVDDNESTPSQKPKQAKAVTRGSSAGGLPAKKKPRSNNAGRGTSLPFNSPQGAFGGDVGGEEEEAVRVANNNSRAHQQNALTNGTETNTFSSKKDKRTDRKQTQGDGGVKNKQDTKDAKKTPLVCLSLLV